MFSAATPGWFLLVDLFMTPADPGALANYVDHLRNVSLKKVTFQRVSQIAPSDIAAMLIGVLGQNGTLEEVKIKAWYRGDQVGWSGLGKHCRPWCTCTLVNSYGAYTSLRVSDVTPFSFKVNCSRLDLTLYSAVDKDLQLKRPASYSIELLLCIYICCSKTILLFI